MLNEEHALTFPVEFLVKFPVFQYISDETYTQKSSVELLVYPLIVLMRTPYRIYIEVLFAAPGLFHD